MGARKPSRLRNRRIKPMSWEEFLEIDSGDAAGMDSHLRAQGFARIGKVRIAWAPSLSRMTYRYAWSKGDLRITAKDSILVGNV